MISGIKITHMDTDTVYVEIDPYLIETKSKEECAALIQQAIDERLQRTGKNRFYRGGFTRSERRAKDES